MKATITFDLNGSQQQHSQYDDLTPEQVAQHLINGGRIWPRHQADRSGNPKFEGADFAVVAIDTFHLSVEHILAADFTQQYAELAVYQDNDQGGSRCILVFSLPKLVTEARDYVLILEGLKTLYAGAVKHHSALHQWGAHYLNKYEVLGGNLNAETVGYLKLLGFESKQLASTRSTSFLRSRVALALDTLLRVEGVEQGMTLDQVGPGVKVFCPVHTDRRPIAKTHRLEDGRLAVCCPSCLRTYAEASAGKKYHFGHFDQVIAELAEADAGKPRGEQIIHQSASRYLPGLSLCEGIMCVKSPKGSGKTEQLENIVREAKAAGKSVLLIGHRRVLLKSMSRRLGLTCYFTSQADEDAHAKPFVEAGKGLVDFGEKNNPVATSVVSAVKRSGDDEVVKVAPASHYAICMDSMPDLDPETRPYDVIIIDEAEQVFAHLVGETLDKKRREIYLRVCHYIRVAKSVVLMDADLGMATMTALFGMDLKPESLPRFWINSPETKAGVVKLYRAKAQVMDRIQRAVEAGEKCYIATNSKTKAEEIAMTLARHNEGLRVASVHRDNSSSPEVQNLLRNITHEFEHNLDVLVGSPSLGTGVDITFKSETGEPRSVIHHTFGIFEGRITTHMDCDQHLMRVRHPGEVHVWIDPCEHNFETDAQILREQLGIMVRNEHDLLGYADNGKPIFMKDDGLVGIWAEVQAASNGSINQLAKQFIKIREDNGYTIEYVELDPDGIKAGQEALKLGREERLRDRAARIVSAESFTTDPDGHFEKKRLEARAKKSLPMTETERARLDRHRLESFYGADVDLDLVKFDAEGRMRGAICNLELLLAPRGREAVRAHYQHQNGRVAMDLDSWLLKRTLLTKLFQTAGVFKHGVFQPAVVFEHSSLKRFIAELEKQRGQVELAFGLAMRRDADRNRVQQLGDVLRLVGLSAKVVSTEDSGGKKIRRYTLDENRFEQVSAIAKARLKSWFKQEHDNAQDELHDQSDQWSHEQEGMAVAA